MPSAQRSGLSATFGLVLVVALLLVAGTLAVTGGGILTTGGRLGVDPVESATPDPGASGDPASSTTEVIAPVGSGDPVDELIESGAGTSFDFTCNDAAIKDLSRGKWRINQFVAGARDEYDRITWRLSRASKNKAKNGSTVTMRWMAPREAQSSLGTPARVQGDQALVVTFDGPVDINVNQTLDQLFLEREGIEQVRNIQMFDGEDGDVHTVIGLRGDACARMSVKGKAWNKSSKNKNAEIFLDIERF